MSNTNFPGAIDTGPADPSTSDTLASNPHHTQHGFANDAIIAVENKVGSGASIPSNGTLLSGNGAGSSAWVSSLTSFALTTPKITTSLFDTNGNTMLGMTPVASAVNYLNAQNAATGGNPKLSALGSDASITLDIQPKGSAGIIELLDGNGNAVVKTGAAISSAVNQVTITNAATGNAPLIGSSGSDANVDLIAAPKGTGQFYVRGRADGWIDPNESWTFASSTTITVPTDATTKYDIGDYIKLTQSATVKYFEVTAVAATLLTVTGLQGATVANAAITANFYSNANNPHGLPSDGVLPRRAVASGSFAVNGAGNTVITGLGFNPRVIQIQAILNQSQTNGHNLGFSNGVYDRIAGTQSCVIGAVAESAGSGTAGGTSNGTNIVSVEAPLGTPQVRGTISATSNDGFTFNCGTFGTVGCPLVWTAWA